eukprot:Nitzschia sp. Nitz4//scaffold59_size112058//20214//21056//NITZ4_004101-RA/size112058-processed-gene-0.182-mRNA-1//1//CDS//3329555099//743//frame0
MSSSSSSRSPELSLFLGLGLGLAAGAVLGRTFALRAVAPKLAGRPAYKPGDKPTLPSPTFGEKIHVFDPSKLKSAYSLMISTATPRPIALVSTTNQQTGISNVAPFSYFGVLGHDPPMLAIGFCRNRNAQLKDSITNILANKEFVVNIISEWYIDAANHSCGAFSPDTDEFVESGLTKRNSCQVVKAPRVGEAAISYECQVVHVHNIVKDGASSSADPTTEIVLAKIVRIHVDDYVLPEGGNVDMDRPSVDTAKLRPLGRLGGNVFATLGEFIDIPRPQV